MRNIKTSLITIGQIVIVLVIYAASQFLVSIFVDQLYRFTKIDSRFFYVFARLLLNIFAFFFLFKLYVRKILKQNLSYFRITKPDLSLFSLFLSLLLPGVLISFYIFFTKGEIIYISKDVNIRNLSFALKAAFVAGIIEEMLFRGFIMKQVENRWGRKTAVIAPSMIFALLHVLKGVNLVDFILLFIAGTLVGIMFSLLTYSRDNIWGAAIVHIFWNFIIIGVVNISPEVSHYSFINYIIVSDNVLLSGGQFGVEASIPAICAYLIVIFLVGMKLVKKEQISSKIGFNSLKELLHQSI